MTDWRLTNQEKYLRGIVLVHKKYEPQKNNDHDHCEFCGAKFSLLIADALKEGWSSSDRYWWICNECFEDFKDSFHWKTA